MQKCTHLAFTSIKLMIYQNPNDFKNGLKVLVQFIWRNVPFYAQAMVWRKFSADHSNLYRIRGLSIHVDLFSSITFLSQVKVMTERTTDRQTDRHPKKKDVLRLSEFSFIHRDPSFILGMRHLMTIVFWIHISSPF